MPFQLTSHEVMRGVKLKDGALVIRQSGGVIFWALVRVGLGAFLVFVGFRGAFGWLAVLFGAVFAVDALLWVRCRVVVSPGGVVVTNRFRRRRLESGDVDVRVGERRHVLPILPRLFFDWYRAYEVGEAFLDHGRRLRLDALIGLPGDTAPDPSPVAMKVSTLNRYLASVRPP